MPLHDWTRVVSGTYHHFHQRWMAAIADALNTGSLPPGYFALTEQRIGGPETDVLALHLPASPPAEIDADAGVAVLDHPPATRFIAVSDSEHYARRADRLTIRHREGDVVAVIEIVSPGNKDGRHAIRAFIEKSTELLRLGIHLLVVDPFPPGPRDPQGIHGLIWPEFADDAFELPNGQSRTLAAYQGGGGVIAYVEPVAVGDLLMDMPLFLAEGRYVPCPLESTYQAAWDVFPQPLKGRFEPPET